MDSIRVNGELHYIYDYNDFVSLVGRYMGDDARHYAEETKDYFTKYSYNDLCWAVDKLRNAVDARSEEEQGDDIDNLLGAVEELIYGEKYIKEYKQAIR